jgi:hypothetical protein
MLWLEHVSTSSWTTQREGLRAIEARGVGGQKSDAPSMTGLKREGVTKPERKRAVTCPA